jgi:RNA polymerase sigma-70 factor (ECF subfamily)
MNDLELSDSTSAVSGGEFASLLEAARGGSLDSLGRLLEFFRDYLNLTAEAGLDSALRPKAAASDLVQESMLEAQRDFHHFRGGTEAEFRAWLKRILLNNLLNAYRLWQAKKRQLGREVPLGSLELGPSSAGSTTDPTPSKIACGREQRQRLQDALLRLPAHYREAILLRHRDGHSFEQIGLRLSRTADAARMLWYRAFKQLGLELEGVSVRVGN